MDRGAAAGLCCAIRTCLFMLLFYVRPHCHAAFFIMHGLIATAAAEKKAQTTAPARGGGRGMSVGARGVLQTELMGLITALRQRNQPKWTSRAAVSRGGFFLRDDPDTDHGIFSARLSIPMVGLVGGGEGRWVSGSGMHRRVVPLRASTWGRPGKGAGVVCIFFWAFFLDFEAVCISDEQCFCL